MQLINLKEKLAELERLTVALQAIAEQANIMEAHPSDVVPIKKAQYIAVMRAVSAVALTAYETLEICETNSTNHI